MLIGWQQLMPVDTDSVPRDQDSVFHKTEMKIWAGQKFLAAHIVLPKGQHLLS